MAPCKPNHFQLKGILKFLILGLAIACATPSRILDEEVDASTLPPGGTDSVVTPGGTAAPAAVGSASVGSAIGSASGGSAVGSASAGSAVGSASAGSAVGSASAGSAVGSASGGSAVGSASAGSAVGSASAGSAVGSASVGTGSPDHTLTFFMHDILGGSIPSAIAVTGLVTNPALSGQVPFAKPNGAVLPVNNGVPVNNANSGIINNNNIPFLTGLSGMTPNLVQQNGNSIIGGGFGFPALNVAQFPTGTTFQKLMFGTMTVFDDELTEGHDLGSGLVGKAQGFYISSSEDGTSQTMAFTVMFASGSYADSLSFFGVHRTGVSESHLAIMGGTGKYVNAKGLATVKTFPASPNQHVTDGMETVLEITVYLAY